MNIIVVLFIFFSKEESLTQSEELKSIELNNNLQYKNVTKFNSLTSLKKSGIIEVDLSQHSLAFSKIARIGKVSVFILSTHFCKPCITLKENLEQDLTQNKIDTGLVDIYYCLLTKNSSESLHDIQFRTSYINIKNVDGFLSFLPATYILAPTTNGYMHIEGSGYEEINEIKNVIDLLSKSTRDHFSQSSLVFQ